jgi:hypothetical protein
MEVNEQNNRENQQNNVWNIKSILSNIFAYTDRKDLIEFNTVCKKWSQVINPIIHKTIKLNRSSDITNGIYDKGLNSVVMIDAEVVECISKNVKHAPYVKEFHYIYDLKPQRAIEVFETFRFISNLSIEDCNMSQDQFLGILIPLNQLQDLTLNNIYINSIITNKIHNEAAQLPYTLKKLRHGCIQLVDNPELFVKTINSHNSLVEFTSNSYTNNEFLEPFYKPYPSLLNFELVNIRLHKFESLFAIFKNNPQLISLKLSSAFLENELVSHISTHLINLEELKFSKNEYYYREHNDTTVKFSQSTKIKKLNLHLNSLNDCSLNSILLNCPELEELDLNPFTDYTNPNSVKSLNLFNPTKLKKLAINCDALDKGIFDSVLFNCPHISDLNIKLPCKWNEAINSIYINCANLEKLTICSSINMRKQELDIFYQEFYVTRFFTDSPKCKSTLTHLTLNNFTIHDSKAEYFIKFKKLKYIKYPYQPKSFSAEGNEFGTDMNLWPGYILLKSNNSNMVYDAELRRYKIIN